MSRTDIAALREALRAATPGPWRHFNPTNEGVAEDDVRVCYERENGKCEWCVALAGTTEDGSKWTAETLARWHADAALIALLRNEAEALLTELEAARAVVEAATAVNKFGGESLEAYADLHDTLTRYRAVVGT